MRLLREWVRIILEGYAEDQEKLVGLYPEHQNEIRQMKPKMIFWFIRRFGDESDIKETHPFSDCIPTVKQYDAKAAGLGQKYNTNQFFKSLVDKKIPNKKWSNPADYILMTVDDMVKIMELSERKKPRFEIEGNEPNRSDFLGKFGPWNLWMPTTMENSVKIAGYDLETYEPDTTWCTARVTGSNLFYNYVGQGIILFYLIKDNPQGDNDWLSVGFRGDKPELSGMDGGLSVNRNNDGLTEKKLKKLLGNYYEQLMNVMSENVEKIGEEHPAKKKIEEAGKSLSAYQNLIKGLGKDERLELTFIILSQKSISPQILEKLSNDNNRVIRGEVARNRNTPAHVLEKLSNDDDMGEGDFDPEEEFPIRGEVALNRNTPTQVLVKLSKDKNPGVRKCVAMNPNTPMDILSVYAESDDESMKLAVSKNLNTPVQFLIKFLNDENVMLKMSAIQNPNTPIDFKEILKKEPRLTYLILRRRDVPVELFEKFVDSDYTIKSSIAANESAPIHVLEKLANDKNISIRNTAKIVLSRKKKQQLAELRSLIRGLI